MRLFLTLLFLLSLPLSAEEKAFSFSQAKRQLVNVYQTEVNPVSLYCGCDMFFKNNKPKPDLKSCGYAVRKQQKRANRVEWEHVVSAWEYGHERQCWQQSKGGRKSCAKTDTAFRSFEGDMHNLFPAVGEVNGDRSNYRFGLLASRASDQYGECSMKVEFKRRIAEPPVGSRGTIARAYFYMSDKHGLQLSAEQRNLFITWDAQHPPTKSECRIHEKVSKVQGDRNPYISKRC